jgi:hypothetical protein
VMGEWGRDKGKRESDRERMREERKREGEK